VGSRRCGLPAVWAPFCPVSNPHSHSLPRLARLRVCVSLVLPLVKVKVKVKVVVVGSAKACRPLKHCFVFACHFASRPPCQQPTAARTWRLPRQSPGRCACASSRVGTVPQWSAELPPTPRRSSWRSWPIAGRVRQSAPLPVVHDQMQVCAALERPQMPGDGEVVRNPKRHPTAAAQSCPFTSSRQHAAALAAHIRATSQKTGEEP
jgi:hypothetical protein